MTTLVTLQRIAQSLLQENFGLNLVQKCVVSFFRYLLFVLPRFGVKHFLRIKGKQIKLKSILFAITS